MDTYYSVNREQFNHDQMADAVGELLENGAIPGDVVEIYEGELEVFKPAELLPHLPDSAREAAYEQDHGEYSASWLDVSSEQEEELMNAVKKVFLEWLDKHNQHPTFGGIKNIVTHKVRIVGDDGDSVPA